MLVENVFAARGLILLDCVPAWHTRGKGGTNSSVYGHSNLEAVRRLRRGTTAQMEQSASQSASAEVRGPFLALLRPSRHTIRSEIYSVGGAYLFSSCTVRLFISISLSTQSYLHAAYPFFKPLPPATSLGESPPDPLLIRTDFTFILSKERSQKHKNTYNTLTYFVV